MKLPKYSILDIIDKAKKTKKLELTCMVHEDASTNTRIAQQVVYPLLNELINLIEEETPFKVSKYIEQGVLTGDKFKFLKMPELYKACPRVRGIYLLNGISQILYDIGGKISIICVVNNTKIMAFCMTDKPITEGNYWRVYAHSSLKMTNSAFRMLVALCIRLYVFKKYAPIETRIVEGNGKLKYSGVKYINPNKQPIHIVDSNWYTNIIRNTPFGVSGHFRLQPCGVGFKDLKLVYIAPYVKKGYKRVAKKTHLQDASKIQ